VLLFVFTLNGRKTRVEKAAAAVDEAARKLHQAMESKWMDLAASTGVVERVDLFLQSREFGLRLSPSDLCPDCHERMLVKAVEGPLNLQSTPSNVKNCGSKQPRLSSTLHLLTLAV
jgi:hypothetical protein